MSNINEFAKRDTRGILRAFRGMYNLTQPGAAELLGYTPASWRAYERGARPVPLHLLRHMRHYTALNKLIYDDPE